MKELVRLIDGDANAAQRSLLEAAQAHRPPDDQARARTLAALTAVTGGVAMGSAAVAVTSGKSLGAGAALARALSPAILKWCAVVTVGTGVSASAVLVVRHEIAVKGASVVVAGPAAILATGTSQAHRVSSEAIAAPSFTGPAPDLAPPALPGPPATRDVTRASAPFSITSTSERGAATLPPPATPVAPRPTALRSGAANAAPAPTPSVASPVAPTLATPATSFASVPSMATAASPSAPPPASVLASLSPEVRMLDEARAHLSSHDPANALAALDRYVAAFPAGVFLPEARVLRIEALLLAGDRASATRLADDLLRGDPSGPYAQRVRKIIQK